MSVYNYVYEGVRIYTLSPPSSAQSKKTMNQSPRTADSHQR